MAKGGEAHNLSSQIHLVIWQQGQTRQHKGVLEGLKVTFRIKQEVSKAKQQNGGFISCSMLSNLHRNSLFGRRLSRQHLVSRLTPTTIEL